MKENEPIGTKARACLDPDVLVEVDGSPGYGTAHIRASTHSVVLPPGGWTGAA